MTKKRRCHVVYVGPRFVTENSTCPNSVAATFLRSIFLCHEALNSLEAGLPCRQIIKKLALPQSKQKGILELQCFRNGTDFQCRTDETAYRENFVDCHHLNREIASNWRQRFSILLAAFYTHFFHFLSMTWNS